MSCSNHAYTSPAGCGDVGQIVRSITIIPKPGGRLRKGKKIHCKIVTGKIACDQPQGRQLRFANRFTKLQDHIEKYYESGLVSFVDYIFRDMTHKQRRNFIKQSRVFDRKLLRRVDRIVRATFNL